MKNVNIIQTGFSQKKRWTFSRYQKMLKIQLKILCNANMRMSVVEFTFPGLNVVIMESLQLHSSVITYKRSGFFLVLDQYSEHTSLFFLATKKSVQKF